MPAPSTFRVFLEGGVGCRGVPGPDVQGMGGTGPRKIQKEATFDGLVAEMTIQPQKLAV